MPKFIEIVASIPDHIAAGLRNGDLLRHGGEIRTAPGRPGAGTIKYLLRDTFTRGEVLQNLAEPITQLSEGVQQMMGMTQVAAAASVLNLGVSIVGFAAMYHKLGRIQKAVDLVGRKIDHLGAHLDERLGAIDYRLVELRYLAGLSAGRLEESLVRLQEIRGDLFHSKVAVVVALAERLARAQPPEDRLLEEASHRLAEVRIWLEQSLAVARVEADRPEQFADLFMRFRLWAMTAALEVQVARRTGALRRAVELATAAAQGSRLASGRWASAIMPAHEYGGVYRLGHTDFERFTPEEVRRFRAADGGDIEVLAHPECPPNVLEEADFVGSTSGISNRIETIRPSRVLLITECSMASNLAADHPDVDFVRPCNLCPYMNAITLPKILRSLETMTHEVTVAPDIAERARLAVDRMLEVGRGRAG